MSPFDAVILIETDQGVPLLKQTRVPIYVVLETLMSLDREKTQEKLGIDEDQLLASLAFIVLAEFVLRSYLDLLILEFGFEEFNFYLRSPNKLAHKHL